MQPSSFTAIFAVAAACTLAADHTPRQANSAAAPSIRLRDVAASAGLQFTYQHSPSPEKHLIESPPGGLAVFDYNSDGRPDVFFTNGAANPIAGEELGQVPNRLFRNDGGMRFTDVTDAAA